jgi:hypothetical protein
MEPPKVATTSTSTTKNQCSKPPTILVQVDTPGASALEPSLTNFPIDYIPPRKSSMKSVHLQKEAKYPLVEPEIPP